MKIRDLRQSNKGFTLVEIVVTMVIISVLASITTLGLMSWTHDSEFNKEDRNAELVYMAMRNKLAKDRANGVIFEVNDNYLFCDSDDYNSSSIDDKAKILLDSLTGYIYDKNILKAYIFIEFDEQGDIINVYYSDKTKFYYKSSDVNSISGAKSITELKNNESMRYDLLVGTYMPQ